MIPLFQNFDDFFNDTVRIKDMPAWIILCGYNIGETVQFCALAGEFKKHHGHNIIAVITPKHQHVIDMYAHQFIKVVVISDETMRLILRSGYIPQDRLEINKPFSACWIDRGFRYSDGIRFLSKYPGRGGLSEIDCVRFILHLPWNAKLEPPTISIESENRVFDYAIKSGLRIGRSILLCPINNSAPKLPQVFWNTLAATLVKKGFTVFTNLGGLNPFNGLSEMPIPGTIPINLPIQDVIPFCRIAGNVIIGNNGMSMLIMMTAFKNFKVTQLVSYSPKTEVGHSSLGFQSPTHPEKGNEFAGTYQYSVPELCINTDFAEYLIPYDGEAKDLDLIARIVAEGDKTSTNYLRRAGRTTDCFVTEHLDWLGDLVDDSIVK
jgi:hypothetical protein